MLRRTIYPSNTSQSNTMAETVSEKESRSSLSASSSLDGNGDETDRFLSSGTGAHSDTRDAEKGSAGVRSPSSDRAALVPAPIIIREWIVVR